MYRAGHVGIALLVYAPVGVALALAGRADLAVMGEVIMIALASLPDIDHDLPLVTHRGSTHTIWFAVLVGLVLGATGWALGGRITALSATELAVFGFGSGALSVCAHLLGDVLTPAGIRPFWPLSRRKYSLAIVYAKNPIANYGLLAAGAFTTAAATVTVGGF